MNSGKKYNTDDLKSPSADAIVCYLKYGKAREDHEEGPEVFNGETEKGI